MPKAIKAHSTSKGKQPAVPAPHKGCSRYSRQSHSAGVEIQSSIEESTFTSINFMPPTTITGHIQAPMPDGIPSVAI